MGAIFVEVYLLQKNRCFSVEVLNVSLCTLPEWTKRQAGLSGA